MAKTKIQLKKHALAQRRYALKLKKAKRKIKKSDYTSELAKIDSELEEIREKNPIKRKVRASSLKNLNHYNFVRRNLSSKLREEGVKLEKGQYKEYVKEINDETKDFDLRTLKLDFDRIFKEYVQGVEPEIQEQQRLPFYGVVQELVEPEYDDFEIEVEYGEYSFKGSKEDFLDFYTEPDGMRSYFRENHNDSDNLAELVVEEKTDKRIKFRVDTHDDTPPPTTREAAAPDFKTSDLKKIKQELTARERELKAEKELIAEKRKLAQNILDIKKEFPDMTIKEIKDMLGL